MRFPGNLYKIYCLKFVGKKWQQLFSLFTLFFLAFQSPRETIDTTLFSIFLLRRHSLHISIKLIAWALSSVNGYKIKIVYLNIRSEKYKRENASHNTEFEQHGNWFLRYTNQWRKCINMYKHVETLLCWCYPCRWISSQWHIAITLTKLIETALSIESCWYT